MNPHGFDGQMSSHMDIIRKTAEVIAYLSQQQAMLLQSLQLQMPVDGLAVPPAIPVTGPVVADPVVPPAATPQHVAPQQTATPVPGCTAPQGLVAELERVIEERNAEIVNLHLALTETQGTVNLLRQQLEELGKSEEMRRKIDRLEDELQALRARVGDDKGDSDSKPFGVVIR